MEKETQYTPENSRDEQMRPELSADAIADTLSQELSKVVGLDQDLLHRCVEFLGGMKSQNVAAMLQTLKTSLGEQLLPLLEIMAQHDRAAIAELGIIGMGTVPSFKAAQLLADINETHADKKLRKAARKSLYKLKSVGIEVETTHKPLLRESKHLRYKAMISPIDGTGTQLIMLTQETIAGDLHFLQVVTSDEDGIVECSARRGMTKKMFEKLPENFARQMGSAEPMLVESDYDYAMSLALDAEERSEVIPDEYLTNKELFELAQARPMQNPVHQQLDAETLKNQPYFLRASEELFQNDDFLSWHLPIDEMGEYAQELLDQDDTVIELSPQFQHEQQEEVYQKIVEAAFDEEMVKRLQRRLEIMAFVLMQQGKEDDAKKALTASVTLNDSPQERLKDHPFIHQLISTSLSAAQYVIEDGYDPTEITREEYYLRRDEEGEVIVEFIER